MINQFDIGASLIVTLSYYRLFNVLCRLVTEEAAVDMDRMHTVIHRHVLAAISSVCWSSVVAYMSFCVGISAVGLSKSLCMYCFTLNFL